MARPARYSSTRHNTLATQPRPVPDANATAPAISVTTRLRGFFQRWAQYLLWAAMAVLAVLLAFSLWQGSRSLPPRITQQQIDDAVLHSLQSQPALLSAAAADAAEAIAASVVRVQGYSKDEDGTEKERGVGTGVVIVDEGIILTNLHVVLGAQRVRVTFADGTQSDARITSVQAEDDLAVLQALSIPDDLQAAPLRSTQGLRPGDAVVAVGFPFGIGPSVSVGVISGLRRAFESPEGKRELQNLIQFDAAANPGNSGGPLITLEGEVVGIVTAILNPNNTRTFAGIGFAVPIENAAAAVGSSPF